MADPFEEDNQYTQSLIGTIPTEEQEARTRAMGAATTRFSNAGIGRQLAAGARQFVGGMPFAQSIPGVRDFVNPGFNTQEAQDLQDFRSGMPIGSGLTRGAGNAVPYMAAGAAVPGLLSTPTRGAMTMGATEGANDFVASGNPTEFVTGAARGGISGFLGGLPGKVVTPRTNWRAGRLERARATRERGEIDRIIDESTNAGVDALRGIRSAGPGGAQDMVAAHRARTERLNEGLRDVTQPPVNIPLVNDPFVRDTAMGTLGGAGLSLLMGGHPVGGAVIGGLALPPVKRFLARRANEAIEKFNEGLGRTKAFRFGNRQYNKYINNQFLSDRMRAMINPMFASSAETSMEDSDILRELNRYRPPTLGGN